MKKRSLFLAICFLGFSNFIYGQKPKERSQLMVIYDVSMTATPKNHVIEVKKIDGVGLNIPIEVEFNYTTTYAVIDSLSLAIDGINNQFVKSVNRDSASPSIQVSNGKQTNELKAGAGKVVKIFNLKIDKEVTLFEEKIIKLNILHYQDILDTVQVIVKPAVE